MTPRIQNWDGKWVTVSETRYRFKDQKFVKSFQIPTKNYERVPRK